MKKIIYVLAVILILETSCESVSQYAASGGAVSSGIVSGGEISEDKGEEKTLREPGRKKTIDISFEDASGKKQKLRAGEVDTKDMASSMYPIYEGFVMDDHFYYLDGGVCVWDKRRKSIGSLEDTSIPDHMDMNLTDWCVYGEKAYFILDNITGTNGDYPLFQFAARDLDTREEKIIDISEHYKEYAEEFGGYDCIDNCFVYADKFYIEDSFPPDSLKEFDMNGNHLRTISLKDSEKKEEHVVLLGIMDGKIYSCTWSDSRHILKSWDMVTGEEKKVMEYEQPGYDKKKWSYGFPAFYFSGNNLLIEEYFFDAEGKRSGDIKTESILYWLSLKDGGKMKRLFQREISTCDFYGNNLYYIDDKHFLHRYNLKKDTDKIISKRKVEDVLCAKEGLFCYEYEERGPSYADDVIYHMDFDGKNEKDIFDY